MSFGESITPCCTRKQFVIYAQQNGAYADPAMIHPLFDNCGDSLAPSLLARQKLKHMTCPQDLKEKKFCKRKIFKINNNQSLFDVIIHSR